MPMLTTPAVPPLSSSTTQLSVPPLPPVCSTKSPYSFALRVSTASPSSGMPRVGSQDNNAISFGLTLLVICAFIFSLGALGTLALIATPEKGFAQTDETQVYDAEIAEPGVVSLMRHQNFTPDGIKAFSTLAFLRSHSRLAFTLQRLLGAVFLVLALAGRS